MKVLINNSQVKLGVTKSLCEFNYSLISDDSSLRIINKAVKEKLSLNPESLIIIGVGGSSNGVKAVLNTKNNTIIKALLAESLDSDKLFLIKNYLRSELRAGRKTLINVISKSGRTTEVLAITQVLTSVLKRHVRNWKDYIIITSDSGSELFNLANDKGITALSIDENPAGRYSLFTSAGLFPLGILGFNIKDLIKGARKASIESANKTAFIKHYHYKKGRRINVFFPFSENFYGFREWINQLISESLGKDRKGITPVTSIGTIDLHSMLQLFLEGPDDKFTTFIKIKNNYDDVKVSKGSFFNHDKSFNELLNITYAGVKKSYINHKRPFIELIINDKSEECIGELLHYLMHETILLGKLLKVNTFNQPSVEFYKDYVRRKLKFT